MNKDTPNNVRCIKNLDLAYLVLYTDEYFT